MPNVHPTALIDDDVQLADDVFIGPHCVIRDQVSIGAGTVLHGSTYLQGPLTIGERNRIYPFTSIGFAPQHASYDPSEPGAGTVIGDDNVFREGVTVHRALKDKATTIGNHNFIMGNAHVGHDSIVGNHVTLVQGSVLGGHVTILDHAILGGIAGIHQFCRAGRYSMIAGCTSPVQDVPPFCIFHHNERIRSLNLIGLRRAGLRDHIKPLKQAFDIFFRKGLVAKTALKQIETDVPSDELVTEFVDFIRTTERGITSFEE